jgi:hypothetical protein
MDYQKIKLLGGAEVFVDFGNKMTRCRKCGKPIRFGLTSNGKLMPIVPVGKDWQSHFADCEFAAEFRKTDIEQKIEDREKNEEMLNSL